MSMSWKRISRWRFASTSTSASYTRTRRLCVFHAASEERCAKEASGDFAAWLEQLAVNGHNALAFLLGASLGLAPTLRPRANLRRSFGPMMFPHQLMRLTLEQVYRGFKIRRGEPGGGLPGQPRGATMCPS